MITLLELFSILIFHWIADFIFQNDKEAKGKSKNNRDLLSHTFKYTWIITIGIVALSYYLGYSLSYIFYKSMLFWFITFIAHTITDYFTSRLNSKLWQQGKSHEFFISVGADQIYHYLQLFLTYYFLLK